MLYDYADIRRQSWTYSPRFDTRLYETDVTIQKPIEFDHLKNSVNTGSFKPNVWRTNPYSILGYEESVIRSDRVEMYKPGNTYTWTDIRSGALGLYVMGDLRTLFDEILQETESDDFGPHALQKAYSKVGKAQLAVGIEIGELKETIEFLRSPFKKLRDYFLKDGKKNLYALRDLRKALRSGKRGKQFAREFAERTGKSAADTWLEMRYALRPIIISIEQIAEEMAKKKREFDPNKVKTARTIRTIAPRVKNDSGLFKSKGVTLTLALEWRAHVKVEKSFFASVGYKRQWDQTVGQKLMVSPEFLPEIALELTRLSFVAGWFFTLNEWLGSYRVKPGIEILGNTVGRKTVVSGELWCERVYCSTDSTCTVKGSVSPVSLTKESYNRTTDEVLSILPLVDVDIDTYKVIDSVSLILKPLLRALHKEGFRKKK